ncbi:glycosyltransferase family 9 protein [Sulfurivermis fontis]|uniref:glycosyltransferase family 9 protein n=1 Tax=Sulfurivermis fontis TaxID=1972068 RepID=UPI000FD7E2EE
MLSWPSFAWLKASMPEAQIVALVPPYTAPMAAICPGIDSILVDDRSNASSTDWVRLARQLRAEHFDAVITLFSTGRVALATAAAGIPYRLAPATKVAQFLYNHRLKQRRSRSEKPEYQYNLDLVEKFLTDFKITPAPKPTAPFLRFAPDTQTERRAAFCDAYMLQPYARVIFIHPGSGGSASNLSVEQYAALATALHSQQPLYFVIGCGPGEDFKAEALAALLGDLQHTILRTTGIADYARHIACADLFISGSTGPLHIAGALDVPTAAFYPRRRSATPLRWQTLNSPERRLAFTPPDEAGETDMGSIDVVAAAQAISRQFLTD